ncbi:tetratricopeptide repeat protein [Flexivirga oryzae]|uniref:Tetratricopeptide (TPR) repeat protein n=1 Tax=Flexivirga oryzae TaxID=1794944 RepID=A0A839N2B5_9MICO|nr:tetratricopeptide repeat protein [Flexivirga oryzae]MBB2891858.1 tetratricopeptide (TPR) repeat protein [Flexivirga oryzae]
MPGAEAVLRHTDALLSLKRPHEAERLLRPALLHEPENASLHLQLSRALAAQGNLEQAREEARRSLAIVPGDVRALLQLSAIEAARGDRPAALHAARRAVANAPNSAAAHCQVGAVLINSGSAQDALFELRKARGLSPEYLNGATTLALAHLQLRQYGEARTQVADALRLDPSDPDAHRVAGLIEAVDGGSRDALAASREAMRLDPLDALNREAFAEALKSRNPVYRFARRHTRRERSHGRIVRSLRIYAAALVLFLIAEFVPRAAVGSSIVAGLLVFALWSIDPASSLVVYLSGHRDVLTTTVRRSVLGYFALCAIGVGSVVWGLIAGHPEPLWAGVVAGIWAIAAGHAHRALPELLPWLTAVHVIGGALVLVTCVLAASGGEAFVQTAVIVGLGGLVAWFGEILDWRTISAGGES